MATIRAGSILAQAPRGLACPPKPGEGGCRGERGRWTTPAFSTNLSFLPRKAAGDASPNAIRLERGISLPWGTGWDSAVGRALRARQGFLERLRRQWAIETGILERLYSLFDLL